jgi:hypothetical protein
MSLLGQKAQYSLRAGVFRFAPDSKAFATNQTGGNACLDDPFEHTTENVSLAEALVAGA